MCERGQESYTDYHGVVWTEASEYTEYLSASTTAVDGDNDMDSLPQKSFANNTTASTVRVEDNDTDSLPLVTDDNINDVTDTLALVAGDSDTDAATPVMPTQFSAAFPATPAMVDRGSSHPDSLLKAEDEKSELRNRRESALKMTTPKPFQCGLCGAEFSVSARLKKHMKTHGRRCRKAVRCGKCLKTFRCTSALAAHMMQIHLDQQCTICAEKFADAGLFRAHMKAHEKCEKSKNPRTYLCEWCSKMFSAKSCLKIHTRQHTGEEPFMCDFCPARFKQQSNLNRHLRVHTGEKPYTCPQCKKTFKGRTGLNMHMLIHKGEKNVKCAECPAAFVAMIGLKAHMRCAHSDARPYACDQCEAAFKTSFHLKRHKFLHTGEKPFKCSQCSATFIQSGNMKIHMKVHSKGKQTSDSLSTSSMVDSNDVPAQAPTFDKPHSSQARTADNSYVAQRTPSTSRERTMGFTSPQEHMIAW